MAVEQALSSSPKIKARYPNLRIPGPIKFAPILLWIGALGFWWIGPVRPVGDSAATSVEGIDLRALVDRRAGSTNFEYEQLETPFQGAPVNVKGSVKDVSQEEGIAIVALQDTADGYAIDLRFRLETSEPVFRLRRGNVLSAKCQFKSMGTIVGFLNRCELTPPP